MSRQWILASQEGFETSLQYQENVKIPSQVELGPNEVLVKLHAASLNYREIQIADPNVSKYCSSDTGPLLILLSYQGTNGPIQPPIIPGCDGAGEVLVIGSTVTEFQPGDRVITWPGPRLAEQRGDDAFPGIFPDAFAMLGQGSDGTLRSHGVFAEKALVHAPLSLNWIQAATLSCNWTTAWNAIFAVEGKKVGPGSWVLVQGTGGVSVAMLQLAVAAGATVIATTSNSEKEARLRTLGAQDTVNYRSDPNWGQTARSLTPEGRGFDIVVDVGGNETLPQSIAAVRINGVVTLTGAVGGKSESVDLFAAFMATCWVRGILLGTRNQLKQVVRYIDEKGIKPAVDDVVFELAEAKEAYSRLNEKKHFAKVVIRIDHPED